MIVCDSTLKSISVQIIEALTTPLDFTVSYADMTSAAFTEGGNDGTLTGSSTKTSVMSAPTSGTKRALKLLTVYNPNSYAVTGFIILVNDAAERIIEPFSIDAYANYKFTGEPWTAVVTENSDLLAMAWMLG